MKLISQANAITQLTQLASQDRHSILIEGASGSGKSYLANLYGTMLNRPDIVIQYISPTVAEIKEAVEACAVIQSPVLLCIENLDLGVPAASYALLKFLEEPTQFVYIVVTCRNIKHVPDTILSRSACVNVAPPIAADIIEYATLKDARRLSTLSSTKVWACISTFRDVDYVMQLSDAQLEYFEHTFPTYLKFTDSISNLSWSLCHFADNAEIPVEFSIKYLMRLLSSSNRRNACIQALKDLSAGRIGSNAILCKLLFECKYGGG